MRFVVGNNLDHGCVLPRTRRPAWQVYAKDPRLHGAGGEHKAHGKIVDKFTQKVTKTIKGSEVTREASAKEPAYLIEQEDGDKVLKSASELTRG